jgi:hypothetical protein
MGRGRHVGGRGLPTASRLRGGRNSRQPRNQRTALRTVSLASLHDRVRRREDTEGDQIFISGGMSARTNLEIPSSPMKNELEGADTE